MIKLSEKRLKEIIKEAIEDTLSNVSSGNDDKEILINASVNDISFTGEEIEPNLYKLDIVVNDKPLAIEGLLFEAELKPRIANNAYQLHIILPSDLRQKGIATKLYTVFLKTCGDIISLYSNRVGSYAKTVGKEITLDSAIDKILVSTAKATNANVERLYSDNKEIGIIVSL